MSASTLSALTLTPTAKTAALALALLGAFGTAHAQSSYALTKLNPPFLGKTELTGQIDSQNRVTATVAYLAGYNLFGPQAGPVYNWYVSRWSASTAASASPGKLISQSRSLDHQSPDGGKLLVSSDARSYYDAVQRQFVALPSVVPTYANWLPHAINDGGVIVGTGIGGSKDPAVGQTLYALRWMPGAPLPEALPIDGTINRASGIAVNGKGWVAGMVGVKGEVDLWHAVLWRESGAYEVLYHSTERASTPIALNEAGDVLIKTEKLSEGIPGFAVVSQGVSKPIASPHPDDRLSANDINDGGVVVGTVTPAGAAAGTQDRAFIWKDGVFNDLTAWVAGKGVRLPAGAVLSAAWSINAQGSILAGLREANGKTTLVRLTARP